MELWEHDLYELLGVEEDASAEEIRKAYKSLASELHPDRFPDDIEKRNEATARFSKITAAYQILKDEEEKAEYDFARRLGFGGASVAPFGHQAPKAEQQKQPVDEVHVTQARTAQAKNQYEQGVAYMGRKKWRTAINCLQEAIKLEPKVADYHVMLGLAYQKQGIATLAQRSFAQAHKLDPRHDKLKKYYTPAGQASKNATGLMALLQGLFGKKADSDKKQDKPKGRAKSTDKKKTKK